jgi:hypothetical protein
MSQSDQSMVPPLMGLSVQMQGSEFNRFCLCHGVKLEVGIQLLNPCSSCGFARTIKRGDGELPNLPHEINVLLTPVDLPWPVPILDIAVVL